MGFRSSEISSFATSLLELEGVTGVWILTPNEREAYLWVTVEGFDEPAVLHRRGVYDRVEAFYDEHRDQMSADFAFDYHVLVDDPDLDEPHVPSTARRVKEAA
jgi:hypothetical protein